MSHSGQKRACTAGTAGLPDWTRLNQVQQIRIDLVKGNPKNPRSTADQGKFERLMRSIKRRGILMPLVGRPGETPEMVLLHSGHRRLDAARRLKLPFVPVLLVPKDCSKSEIRELLLAYNFHEALPPLDQARVIQEEIIDSQAHPDDVIDEWALDPDETKQCIAMLDTLSPKVQHEVNARTIPVDVGYLISRVDDHQAQEELADGWLDDSLSKAKLKRLVQELVREKAGLSRREKRTGKRLAHSRSGNEQAEYKYAIPDTINRAGVVVSISSTRGMSVPQLRQALEYVIKTHLVHREDD